MKKHVQFAVLLAIVVNASSVLAQQDTLELDTMKVLAKIGTSIIEPGKVIYTTDDLPSQNGGTAGDILKGMISLYMGGGPNHNRDVRFRGLGNAYTKVLINGKEPAFIGNNREAVLDQIPASSIERIEILSTPNATQTGEGLNGLINIVLNKATREGIHGTFEIGMDITGGRTAGGSISADKKGFGVEASVNFLNRNIDKQDITDMTKFKDGAVDGFEIKYKDEDKQFDNYLLQFTGRSPLWTNGNIEIGFTRGSQIEDKVKTDDITKMKADASFNDASVISATETKNSSWNDGFLSIQQKIRKNVTIDGQLTLSLGDQNKFKIEDERFYLENGSLNSAKEPKRKKTDEIAIDTGYGGKIELTWKNTQGLSLSSGYSHGGFRREMVKLDSTYNQTSFLWTLKMEDSYLYREYKHAGWIHAKYLHNRFLVETGFRFEAFTIHTVAAKKYKKGSPILAPLPNLSLSYTILEAPTHTLVVNGGVGRRIRKPAYKDFNPFIVYRHKRSCKMESRQYRT